MLLRPHLFRYRLAVAATCAALLFPTAHSASSNAIAPPCQVGGGGCLNLPGQPTRHVQATFGGTVTEIAGGTWEHVQRDGRSILFRFDSRDARVSVCRPDPNGACRAPGMASRADLIGTGTFTTATDSVPAEGNFHVDLIDRGSCEGETRDSYSITVRRGLVIGQGEIVHSMAGDLGCGNLKIDAPWNGPAGHPNQGAQSP
jgi:hypothetical protein